MNSMSSILFILNFKYNFQNIKNVYHIYAPHHSYKETIENYDTVMTLHKPQFYQMGYNYNVLYSGIDHRFEYNIGIPRVILDSSFKVSPTCYGLIRHRYLKDFYIEGDLAASRKVTAESLAAEVYLSTYFEKVKSAGAECKERLSVMAIGIEPARRVLFLKVANKFDIEIDFCDRYPNYRLPHQGDFLEVLSTLKERKGIVSFDRSGTQSLIQALSIGTSALIYTPSNMKSFHAEFYNHFVSFLPDELQPTARTILGLSNDFHLLKDEITCNRVYTNLHHEINKAHKIFSEFKQIFSAPKNHLTILGVTQGFSCSSQISKIPARLISATSHIIKEIDPYSEMPFIFSDDAKSCASKLESESVKPTIFELTGISQGFFNRSNALQVSIPNRAPIITLPSEIAPSSEDKPSKERESRGCSIM